MKLRLFFIFAVSALFFTSCGEYNRILKSSDTELKYTYAKKYFEQKKYGRASSILEDIVPSLKGTSKAEEALYLLAQSFFYNKDYTTATQYYKTYYTTYPKGEYIEIAHFNAAYGMYLDSPDYRLDQTPTISAINEFQNFIELFPRSDKLEQAQKHMFELQDKLAEKDLGAVRLYYNLGNYMGNNFESCVITARNAIKSYPYSKFLEEFQTYIVRSKYELAINSIEYRQPVRYRDVIDEYYNYKNMFPDGKHLKELEKYFNSAEETLKNLPEYIQPEDILNKQTIN
ncbi:MAG: outer membrane protein assembly factor BamD [Bacteroidetes bacterium]|jgi:outer membrane protein assembly factor BamD|nr:outer membrane protein assembly factor BamD [Bacteroidota bacterium]